MTDLPKDLDARLSAFLDDELGELARAEIEALIVSDERVAERLEALALADSDYIETAGEIDSAPMSDSLNRTVRKLEASDKGQVILFPAWRRGMQFVERHSALAACAVIGIAVASFIPQLMGSGSNELPDLSAGTVITANSELGSSIASARGGEVFTVSGTEFQPRFSYLADNEACRLMDATSASETTRFVACMTPDGWELRIAEATPVSDQPPGGPFTTARGPAGEAIEAFLDETMTSAPLGADEETALMEQGWVTREEMTDVE